MNLRVSTTQIESFRLIQTTSWAVEQELVDSIMQKPEPMSWQARAGIAWHAVLADPARYMRLPKTGPYYFSCDSHRFSGEAVEIALAHIGDGWVHEVKAVKTYDVRGLPVNVVAKADAVRGLAIQDNKAKFSEIETSYYDQSLQWRFYLDAHEATAFRYNLWPMRDPKEEEDEGCLCEMKGEPVSFTHWRYPALEDECRGWLAEFVEWAERKRLLPYLRREGTL